MGAATQIWTTPSARTTTVTTPVGKGSCARLLLSIPPFGLASPPALISGPYDATKIAQDWATLMQEFPNAKVRPSTFDAFFAELQTVQDQLPVITEEIAGRSWDLGWMWVTAAVG
jgi:hypothetical protein